MGPKAGPNATIRPYKCSFCIFTFATATERDQHQASHVLPKRFACPHKSCPSKFNTSSDLSKHLKLHNPVSKAHRCPVCRKEYDQKEKLEFHIRKRHAHEAPTELSLENLLELVKDLELRFTCGYCNRRFATKGQQQDHMKKVHTSDSAKDEANTAQKRSRGVHGKNLCPICDNKFKEVGYLRTHLQNVHIKDYDEASALASISAAQAAGSDLILEEGQCPECGRVFMTEGYLRSHIRFRHSKTLDEALSEAQTLSFTTTRTAQFHPSTEPTITQNQPSGLLAEAATTEECDRCWRLGIPCLRFNDDAPCHECTSRKLTCSPKQDDTRRMLSSATMHEQSINLNRQDEMVIDAELGVSREVHGATTNGQGDGWKDSKLKRKFEEVTDSQDEPSSFPRYRHKEYQHLPIGFQSTLTLRWTDEEWISTKESLDPLSPRVRPFNNILPSGFFFEDHPEPNAINPQLAQTLRCLLKVCDSQLADPKLSKPHVNQIYAAASFLHDDDKRCMICGASFSSGVMLAFHPIGHSFNNVGIPGSSWAGTCWESVATAQIFYRTFCASVPAFLSPSSTSLRISDVYVTTDTDGLPGAGNVWFPCDNTTLATSTSARLNEEARRPAPPHVIVVARKSPDGMTETASDMALRCEYLLGFASEMCRAFGWSEIPVSAYTACECPSANLPIATPVF